MDGHAAAAFFIIHLPVFQIIVAGEARVVEGDFAGDIFGIQHRKNAEFDKYSATPPVS